VLYGPTPTRYIASAGSAIGVSLRRHGIKPDRAAWDFLSIALAVVVADFATQRSRSSDGWTRDIDVTVATSDPDRWVGQLPTLAEALRFLTTDRWSLSVTPGAEFPIPPREIRHSPADAVALLSGGLDSLVGAIDLVESGIRPLVVSQIVRGDSDAQRLFAQKMGGGLEHVQLNHNARTGGQKAEASQRSRSLVFIAFAVLVASAFERYTGGDRVVLYLNENGFIAINPPLTPARVGSLSTRTAHPAFLNIIQDILDDVGLRVDIVNPYLAATKGEMLQLCRNQELLAELAPISTSCGRFQRHGYRHCGRCLPCQIRRAAFVRWGVRDETEYVYRELGLDDRDHAAFDDVRAVALAIAVAHRGELHTLIGPGLSSLGSADRSDIRAMIARGIDELAGLHGALDVK
jgi:7-cyano-7-deazaguanine synthase in queuosine biosynthesis